MERLCIAFADSQAVVVGGDGANSVERDPLTWLLEAARTAMRCVRASAEASAVFRKERFDSGRWATAEALHAALREWHPIRADAGFEGNAGVEGGVWRALDGGEDAIVHLRFLAGTQDLPLHIHEFSDRLIVVTYGMGLFHYMPDGDSRCELRSVVVEPGDLLIFTHGLIHTFTAPISDLTLLSYHGPFFELEDPRQYTIPAWLDERDWAWEPAGLVRKQKVNGAIESARKHDIAGAVR